MSLFLWKGFDDMIEKKQLNIELTMAIVEFNLKQLIDKNGIYIYMMSQLTKTKYYVIKKGEIYTISTGFLAKSCYILNYNDF